MGQNSERVPTLSGVAETSLGVAALRAIETSRDDRLFEDPYAHFFVAAASGSLFGPSARPPDLDFYRLMAPQVAVRTRFFDDALLAAAGVGAQVVLLACGLDARALRLRWPRNTRVFEVDLAETLAFKDAVLAQRHSDESCDRVTVSVDLREDWPAALAEAGWQDGAPTLWLAEGIWYALSTEDADRLLQRLTSHSAAGSELTFDHVLDSDLLRAARAAVSPELVELWRGGPAEPLSDWLQRHGWYASVHDLRDVAADYHRSVPAELAGAATEVSRAWLVTATFHGAHTP